MPTHKLKVTFDNNAVYDGYETAIAMTDALAANGGNPGAQVNHVLDDDGKLISLELELPDAASENAKSVIDNLPGIVNRTEALPEPLFISDMTTMATALDLRANTGGEPESIRVLMGFDQLANSTFMGGISDNGAGEVYTDGNTNEGPTPFPYGILGFQHRTRKASGGTRTIPASTTICTLTYEINGVAQTPLNIVNATELVFPASTFEPSTTSIQTSKTFYVDTNGNLYLLRELDSLGQPVADPLTFEQAVAAGAV